MTTWNNWADGVLSGIGAPINAANIDTLMRWSNAETAPFPLMRWNNPLNTTQKMSGSWNTGAQPGPHDVQGYPTVAISIQATVITLTNGFYPTILTHLRNGVPANQWSDCHAELSRWGTGYHWLPQSPPTGDDDVLTPEESAALKQLAANFDAFYAFMSGKHLSGPSVDEQVKRLVDDVGAIKAKVESM